MTLETRISELQETVKEIKKENAKLKSDLLLIEEKKLAFAEWIADNMELGMTREAKHYLHLENRIIEISLADAYKVFNGEIKL